MNRDEVVDPWVTSCQIALKAKLKEESRRANVKVMHPVDVADDIIQRLGWERRGSRFMEK